MVFIPNSIPEVNLYIRVKKASVDWFKWFDNVHSESCVETEFSPKVTMSKMVSEYKNIPSRKYSFSIQEKCD